MPSKSDNFFTRIKENVMGTKEENAQAEKDIAKYKESKAKEKAAEEAKKKVAMAKGGSVIKKSGSKSAKAGVTKFAPVKKLAAGGAVKASDFTKKQTAKVGKVMGEFKDKTLHSGKGGKVVKEPKQAIAIALSVASKLKKK